MSNQPSAEMFVLLDHAIQHLNFQFLGVVRDVDSMAPGHMALTSTLSVKNGMMTLLPDRTWAVRGGTGYTFSWLEWHTDHWVGVSYLPELSTTAQPTHWEIVYEGPIAHE